MCNPAPKNNFPLVSNSAYSSPIEDTMPVMRGRLCRVAELFDPNAAIKMQSLSDQEIIQKMGFLSEVISRLPQEGKIDAKIIRQMQCILSLSYKTANTKLSQPKAAQELLQVWIDEASLAQAISGAKEREKEGRDSERLPRHVSSLSGDPSQVHWTQTLGPSFGLSEVLSLNVSVDDSAPLNLGDIEDAGYLACRYFDAVLVRERGKKQRAWKGLVEKSANREWQLYCAYISDFIKKHPKLPEDLARSLCVKAVLYLSRFAPMVQPEKIGAQVPSWQSGSDSYFRENSSSIQQQLNTILRGHMNLGDEGKLLFVTDRGFDTVLLSNLSVRHVAKLDKECFFPLFEALIKGHHPLYIDVSRLLVKEMKGKDFKQAIDNLRQCLKEQMLHYAQDKQLEGSVEKNLLKSLEAQCVFLANIDICGSQSVYTFSTVKNSEKASALLDEVSGLAQATGYVLGPHQLVDNWVKAFKKEPSKVFKAIEQALHIKEVEVTFPVAEYHPLHHFDSIIDIRYTLSYQRFMKLKGSEFPYCRILSKAVEQLILGLEKEQVLERLKAQGLDEVAQFSLNKILEAMELAAKEPEDLLKYSSQIQIIRGQLSNLLAATPIISSQKDFNELMLEAHPEMCRAEVPNPQFNLTNSGMRSLSAVIEACRGLKSGDGELVVASQSHCYYEHQGVIRTNYGTLDQSELQKSAEKMKEELKGQSLDVYVAEFHHNISDVLDSYEEQDLIKQVETLYAQDIPSKPFTVAIDLTIISHDQRELQRFLEHNTARIQRGELNVVCFWSAQKFDMLGGDDYNGGVIASYNHGKSFEVFNQTLAQAQPARYNLQGLGFMQKYASASIGQYRKSIADNNAYLYKQLKRSGMVATAGKEKRPFVEIAENLDSNMVFIDLRSTMAFKAGQGQEFYSVLRRYFLRLAAREPKHYPVEGRASFGFHNLNVTYIAGKNLKLRFNAGVEPEYILDNYVQQFRVINAYFEQHLLKRYGERRACEIMISMLRGYGGLGEPRFIGPEDYFKLLQREGEKLSTKELLELAHYEAIGGNKVLAKQHLERARQQLGMGKSGRGSSIKFSLRGRGSLSRGDNRQKYQPWVQDIEELLNHSYTDS